MYKSFGEMINDSYHRTLEEMVRIAINLTRETGVEHVIETWEDGKTLSRNIKVSCYDDKLEVRGINYVVLRIDFSKLKELGL